MKTFVKLFKKWRYQSLNILFILFGYSIVFLFAKKNTTEKSQKWSLDVPTWLNSLSESLLPKNSSYAKNKNKRFFHFVQNDKILKQLLTYYFIFICIFFNLCDFFGVEGMLQICMYISTPINLHVFQFVQ